VGHDFLLRSTAPLDPEQYSVEASFRQPELRAIRTEPVLAALAGETGNRIATGRAGNTVLASYAPISQPGLNWAIVSEQDAATAFASATRLLWQSGIAIAILTALVVLATIITTRKVIQP
ncbi:hypothetical protein RZS08_41625, partial [Arthrospira platensis SPKY1]|nr:hypothetical protein [Arthrospira platensis SPKY1]